MSKSKTKVASKNNPTAREQGKSFFFKGKKIKPVKLIAESTFIAAEYENGDLVLDDNGLPLTWKIIQNLNLRHFPC